MQRGTQGYSIQTSPYLTITKEQKLQLDCNRESLIRALALSLQVIKLLLRRLRCLLPAQYMWYLVWELQVIAEGDHTGERARQCRVSAETINDVLLRHRAAVTRTLPVCLLLSPPSPCEDRGWQCETYLPHDHDKSLTCSLDLNRDHHHTSMIASCSCHRQYRYTTRFIPDKNLGMKLLAAPSCCSDL